MSAFPGEFNRSTQHYSLERSGDVCHPLAALPALSGLCLQLRRETTSVHAPPYAYRSNVPDRVEGCCVDRLNPPHKADIPVAPGSRRSISAFGGKGPRAVYLAGGLIGSGGRGVTSATLTVVPGRSMSVTT